MASENQAVSAASFTNSIGINTHLDFTWTAYGNLSLVQNDLAYLGVHNVRDSIAGSGDLSPFVQMYNALGVKFDFFLDPTNWSSQIQQLAAAMPAGSINYIEGANEPDVQGPSLAAAQAAQVGIYSAAHSTFNVPVIQTSFGNINDYGATGDQSAYADFGNAHTYFGTGNSPGWAGWINTLNADAQLTTPGKPVIDTETGYYTNGSSTDPSSVDETVQAKYTLDDLLDSYKAGNPLTYLYELLDTGTGDGNVQDNFGLFHTDGTPKLAATAVHNLMALLSDPNGGGTAPGSLAYDLSGLQSTDNSLLMEKSDGTYWLALWNGSRLSGPTSPTDITVPPHTVTLNLGSAADSVQVFDPLTGTTAVQSFSDTSSAAISVPDHPVLVEIDPSGTGTSTTGTSGSGSSGTGSSGTGSTGTGSSGTGSSGTGSTGTGSSGTGSSGTGTAGSGTSGSGTTGSGQSGGGASPDPVLTVPGAQNVAAGQTATITGISISDPWASTNPGTLALNISASAGTLTMQDGSGNAVAGSGTDGMHISGTLAQLNADLATLSYTGTGAGDSVGVNVWDQAGLQATQAIAIDPATGTGTGTGGTGGTGSTGTNTGGNGTGGSGSTTASGGSATTIAPTDASPVLLSSNTAYQASAGDHMIFLGGTGDTLTATGGTETVQAYQGDNTITTGSGDDTIRYSGSGNTIDAGGGSNTLEDSGSNNTIVLPVAGQGSDDVFGYVIQNNDKFDLRTLLANTSWNGDTATLGNYLSVGMNGNSAVISVTPQGPGGTSYAVATLQDSGALSVAGLLAHSVT